MKVKKLNSIILSLCLVLPSVALADLQGSLMPTTNYNTSTTPGVTTTTAYHYNGPTIKEAAQGSSGKNNLGMILGIGAAAYCGYQAVAPCGDCFGGSHTNCGTCALYTAGLVASLAVVADMTKAKNQSNDTVAAVDAPTDQYNTPPIDNNVDNPPPGQENNPDWKAMTDNKKKLEKLGWKFDPNKNTATSPTGKIISGSSVGSTAGMSSLGASDSQIKAFQDGMAKVQKAAMDKAKGADGEMFDGSIGGGGGAKMAGGMDGGVGGGLSGGHAKLGIDRNPAQVAGMSKNFNGNPIGVAGDSLFLMIDRRYQLHNEKGSFISP